MQARDNLFILTKLTGEGTCINYSLYVVNPKRIFNFYKIFVKETPYKTLIHPM